ncbi:hypothetical protein OC844_004033 [Tilletia horrida]|nr:hypothetical protein OC844_004033 [Tilletia horrida]
MGKMRARRPASSRFCQLFVCCTLLLVIPTLFFLSSSQTGPKLVRDPRTGQWYTVDSLKAGKDGAGLVPVGGPGANPALSQGNGAEPANGAAGGLPALGAEQAQAWRLPGSLSHLDEVLMNKWGSVKEGVNAALAGTGAAQPAQEAGAGAGAGAGPGAGAGAKVKGGPIMPKMTNETARAELGRATWKLLHTMTLRFPDNPTADERATLRTFIESFARLYPCAECAGHFQQLLEELPPQTSSRMAASLWLCTVHNRVNARLGKKEFDCAKLDETYDCGCGDGPGAKNGTGTSPVAHGPALAQASEVFEGLGAGTGAADQA